MTRLTRAGSAIAAGLASFVLTSSVFAGPLGGYGPANNGSAGNGAYVGGQVAGTGCTTGSCGTAGCATGHCHGPREKCPPPYRHIFEGPPCVKFKRGCARPVCNPCEIPHFGYFQTCWSPWPYPPDWRHCPYPTASDMLPAPQVPPYTPRLNAERPPAPIRSIQPKPKDDDNEAAPKTNTPPKKELLPPPGKQEKDRQDLSYSPPPTTTILPAPNYSPPPIANSPPPSPGVSFSQPAGSGGVRLVK